MDAYVINQMGEICKMGETQKEEQQHQQQQQQSQQPSSPSDVQQQLTLSTVSTVSIKLPQLWETNAAAWVVITEAQFSNAHITVDTTKYNYVISSLSNELAGKSFMLSQTLRQTTNTLALKMLFVNY